MRRQAGGSYLEGAAAALVLCATVLTGPGCHFQVSQAVYYKPEESSEAPPPKVKESNDLVAGVARLEVVGADGAEADEEAGDARQLGLIIADGIGDTLVFKKVVHPLRNEEVDVVLKPRLTVSLNKNGLTNALKVFPGLFFPWIDGFGFDYDHVAVLELEVRTKDLALCDTLKGESSMLAERYPSVLWWLGLHAGILVLLVTESAGTDQAVLDSLTEQSAERALRPVLEQLVEEFEAKPRPCPEHPGVEQTGRYCILDGRDLYYPILSRGAAAPPTKPTGGTK